MTAATALLYAPTLGRSARVPKLRQAGIAATLLAVALACYTTWRPVNAFLFTFSDAAFCFALLAALGGNRLAPRPFGRLSAMWFLGLALLLAGLLIGSVAHGDPLRWIIVAAQYDFALALVPMVMLGLPPAAATRQAQALVLGVVGMEAFGICAYLWLRGSYEAAKILGAEFITGEHRLGAFMADANWNASMIAMTLPFVLYLHRVQRLGHVAAAGAVSILAAGTLFSGSVTGVLSTAAAGLLFLIVAGGGRSLRLALPLLLLGGIVVTSNLGVPAAFERRVLGALEEQDLARAGTFTGRVALMQEAWTIVDGTTLVGLGADQYRVVSRFQAPVHNVYLLLWAEGGLAAALGWILMLLVPLAIGLARLRTDRLAAALGLAVLLPFYGFTLAAPHMYARSWIVPVLAAVAIMASRQLPQRREAPHPD
nr:O-antigen ligase family protein [uncultured Sphingomonas sp.]